MTEIQTIVIGTWVFCTLMTVAVRAALQQLATLRWERQLDEFDIWMDDMRETAIIHHI